MSTKFRVVLDMDFGNLAPDSLSGSVNDIEVVKETFSNMVLSGARAKAISDLHAVRKDSEMDMDVKAIKMAEQMRRIMATLMADANLQVEALPSDTKVSTKLPFEDRYAAAA